MVWYASMTVDRCFGVACCHGEVCYKAQLGGLKIQDFLASGHCTPRAGGTNREHQKGKARWR
jgi:hypothetical protein